MKETEYTSGGDIRRITSKAYTQVNTPYGSRIVFALERSGIPYYAKFTGMHISLIYDASRKSSVEEIIARVRSGGYDEIIRTVKESKPEVGYLILLPEVSELLNTTVGTLKNRPTEIQEQLCKAYADLWVCDRETLQHELSAIINVNVRTEEEIERKRHAWEAR